jgi:energy-coupling factor transport system permease protein
VIYRRRASPLHAARAGVGCAYCAALAVAALVLSAPVALGAVALAIAGAALGAGVQRETARVLRFALPLGGLVMVVNALVVRDGLTVIARLGTVPVFGQLDITLEATVAGAVLGLRAIELVLCAALYTTAVDPDEVLRLFRRFSFHSALTATLATRMLPLLARDARRLADAQRCRPGRPPSRAQLMRAAMSGVLDRALDAAAALEVRGYGAARATGRGSTQRRPYSRHDLAFAAAAVAIPALAIAGRAVGWLPFASDPALYAPIAAPGLIVAAVLLACALAPFADRRGIER